MGGINKAFEDVRLMKALTGVSKNEFEEILPEFERVLKRKMHTLKNYCKHFQKQKNKYSDKKKAHKRQHTIICDENSRIILVSPTKNGRIHDKPQLEKKGALNNIPKSTKILVYWIHGDSKTCQEQEKVFMPKEKPRGRELMPKGKDENRFISSIRIVVEHEIGNIKRFRCARNF